MSKGILKIRFLLILCVFAFITFIRCTPLESTDDDEYDYNSDDIDYTVPEAMAENDNYNEDDTDYTWNDTDVIEITLNGDSITCDDAGVSIDDRVATITAAGTYTLSGSLSDGQIIVDTDDEEIVRLIFNGISVYCSNNSPIYLKNAEKTIIVLGDETVNRLRDGSSYYYDSEDDDANATLFSNDDLTICGNGSLTVNAYYNDGIGCDDGIIINGGTITVTAEDDGIRGKDYVVIKEGSLTINAYGDGIKSSNDEDDTRGYVYIMDGELEINSDGDAISGLTDILISGGQFDITSGGGSNNNISDDTSAKGIKADKLVVIDGGTFEINSADDALHTNELLIVNDGDFEIASGDDGIHADEALGINGGTIAITDCFEGLESAYILIADGDIHIVSSDDGINTTSGGSSGGGGPNEGVSSSNQLHIDGGNIVLTTSGDGIDSNGLIDMTDGTLIINGPTSNNNGALDYGISCSISDGLLLALGSSGMAQAPGSSSEQYSVLVYFSSTRSEGTLIHVQSSGGEEVFTFMPSKRYQSIAFSSPKLTQGTSYEIYFGGSSTGNQVDGLYYDGQYTPGTRYTSFTINSKVTRIGR